MMEQLSMFDKPKKIQDPHKVIHNGRFFTCPKCNNNISETILRHVKHCDGCGYRLNWDVWDKEKNEIKKEYRKD